MSVATGGQERIAAAFAGHGKRAALMPYLMGGYPDVEASAAAGLAAAEAGADLIELGIPFSDPLADGPVIHAAAVEALKAGATPHGVLRVCERLAERVPVVLMVYANVVLQAGGTAEAFARRAAAAGASGLIVPDLSRRPRRRSASSGSGPTRAGSSTRSPCSAPPASAIRRRPGWSRWWSASAPPPRCRWRSDSASPRPSRRPPWGRSPTA